jgi:hypothetical protein
VHFIWISGERMKEQGTDGLSWGDLFTGVMAGDDYLNFLPLNERANERHEDLMIWLRHNLPGKGWITLSEEQWFTEALSNPNGRYIWVPPPSIADVAVEQLCEVRHIHPGSSHVLLCPTLMTVRWRKQLRKVSDLLFNIPAGSPIWPSAMFEPLTLALTSPLLCDRPWIMQQDDWVAQRESHMREMLRTDREIGGSYLRQFWIEAWSRAGKVPRSLAR